MLAEATMKQELKSLGPFFIGQVVGFVEPPSQANRCSVAGAWYVLSFEPKQGSLAKAELAKAGLVPYLPMWFGEEPHGRGRTRSSERPMLGCYMFVRCEVFHWGVVAASRGVRRLLGFEGRPIQLRDGEIEVIRLKEAEYFERETERLKVVAASRLAKERGKSGIIWHFAPGDRVRIKAGPCAGLYAHLDTAVDSRDRLRALVEFLGGQQRADLSAFDIEAL